MLETVEIYQSLVEHGQTISTFTEDGRNIKNRSIAFERFREPGEDLSKFDRSRSKHSELWSRGSKHREHLDQGNKSSFSAIGYLVILEIELNGAPFLGNSFHG